MNYFRCTVGGSGKGNTVTVTCAEEFAGLTITLAKTGKTYTKTCPSTAPYTVTFNGVENGTYTVSCTLDGQTYSETVIVQDISCVLNYGFNWQTWVDTASQLDSSDYDTLDEVLEDELALRELFLEHACVDYMASVGASNEDLETIIENNLCAKWINLSDYALDYLYANEVIADLMDEADKYFYGEWALMPQVPKMTSNTAPYGEVASSGSMNSSGPAYYAFDEKDDTRAMLSNAAADAYVQYKFLIPTKIDAFMYYNVAGSPEDTELDILYSDDGTTFISVGETYIYDAEHDAGTKKIYEIPSSVGAHLYWRLRRVRTTAVQTIAYEVQFYTWAPKGNVPIMTANNAPYGAASGTNKSSGSDYYKAFDNDPSTSVATSASKNDFSVYYKFTNPVRIKRLYVATYSGYKKENVYHVEVSNDGQTWVELDDIDMSQMGDGFNQYIFNTSNADYWQYARLHSSGNDNVGYDGIASLQFYGRELKVSVPKMTSNTAPYGEAFGSSSSSATYDYWKAFDNTIATSDLWLSLEASPQYIGYEFPTPTVIKAVSVKNYHSGNRNIKTFKAQVYSNNEWVDASESISNGSTQNTRLYTYFTNNVASKKARIYITEQYGTDIVGTDELKFYGLDYSEKEFESGTTKKWLYDHGVELETISAVTSSDTTFVTKNADNVEVQTTTTGTNRIASAYAVVDTSSFNIARCKFGEVFNPTTNNIEFAVYSALPNYSQSGCSGYVYFANGNSDLPYNCSLDISSINLVDGYISVAARSSSTGYVRDAKLFELWLE